MKCSGKELKDFENDVTYFHPGSAEREATYMDDVLIEVNGVEVEDFDIQQLNDTDKIEIIAGGVLYCTKGQEDQSLESYFRRWKKEQTTVTIIVECDKSKHDAVVAAIKAAGGKVTK